MRAPKVPRSVIEYWADTGRADTGCTLSKTTKQDTAATASTTASIPFRAPLLLVILVNTL
jgi:hypothetical protein